VIRAGVIRNPRSRLNREDGAAERTPAGVLSAAPATRAALDAALAEFAAARLDLLVIDGGDGTVREVLTRAPEHFPHGLPRLAVLPRGKTNALALDLGLTPDWTLEAAIAAAEQARSAERHPLELMRHGHARPLARGFLFGAGVFVRATEIAQRTHRLGAFNDLAVGLTLAAAAAETLAGGPRSPWRKGVPMRLDSHSPERQIFLLLASTLERLPLDLKPFGAPAPGLKTLVVEAPPRRLFRALPLMLSGRAAPWLEPAGYRRSTRPVLDLHVGERIVLDGETYPGGALRLVEGAPLAFVVP
jgi:diacylglycerol kinase (ATP)